MSKIVELWLESHGQRYALSQVAPDFVVLRKSAVIPSGPATLFRARNKEAGAFAPLRAPLDRIHRDLKKSFDPSGVFNPGRLYPGL